MEAIQKMISNLQAMTVEKQEEELLAIISRNEAELLDLNTSQLFKGERADGSKITPEYSEQTVRYKKAVNQPSDRVTLFDEGDFYRGFFADTTKFPVLLESNDIKTGKLVDKYEPTIFGLNQENKVVFSKSIQEDIEEYYRKALGV
jgi:rhodanese-related sulfurtransferase